MQPRRYRLRVSTAESLWVAQSLQHCDKLHKKMRKKQNVKGTTFKPSLSRRMIGIN
jgi:hypothetical protein